MIVMNWILCISLGLICVGFILPYIALREPKNVTISKRIINNIEIKEEDNLTEMIAYFKKNGFPKYEID